MKKIFMLIMSVLMICAAAIPAFAEGTAPATINVNIVDYDGTYTPETIEVPKTPTVKNVLKLIANVSIKDNAIYKVNDKSTKDINSPFGGEWVVAVNGKTTSLDAAIEAGDRITVYWNEPTFNTRLVQVKQLNRNPDVLRFFYYDATGVEVSLTNATIQLTCNGENVIDVIETNTNEFITDESGQVWLAPTYIDDPEDIIKVISIGEIRPDTMPEFETDRETEYYTARIDKSLIICEAIGSEFSYDATDTPATGDMTLIYVGVAIVALTALAIIAIRKKESKN